MKIKLLLLLLLALTLKGFSQEKVIEIQPQKEFTNTVTLTPACGKGNDTELSFTVFWDKKAETLKINFKNNTNVNKMLFFFPKRMFIKKEVMKLRKEVYFGKEIKKCLFQKTVNAGIDVNQLVNVETTPTDIIQTLDFEDSNSAMNLLFNKPFQTNGDMVIPFHFYIASKEVSKKARNRKIEYEARVTLVVKTSVPPPKITPPPPPTPQPTPEHKTVETVNCKTLYRANEQLAELILDMKNSTPANLASLKQKYERIKKSVANPEYKKCKEEYKSFESLCSKIDNRLK